MAEYQAQLARERSAAAAQAQAKQQAEAAARAKRLHETRARAGHEGAAARWAGHEKAKPIPPKHGSCNLDRVALIVGIIWGLITSITRRQKK